MATLVNAGNGDIRENVIIGTLNVNPPPPPLDPLRAHVVDEAMHDSGEVDAQGDCHPGTRVIVQQIINGWAEHRQPGSFVNCMIGAAGAGKSAIMRTVAKTLEEEGKLLGGFFCFRSSKRRNDSKLVIPTLVAQILRRIPSLRPLIHQAFEADDGLLARTMGIQATKLIIDPLNSMDPAERADFPYVILLDGLDEINGVARQQAIIKTFASINEHLHSPLHFLLASRPEPPILQALEEFLGDHWTPLQLDESFKPNDDIDVFYVDHFRKIRDRHPHLNLPLGWPGVPVRRTLVAKGSGQFIFASVVVGVVGDPSSPLSPQERLDLVLEVTKRDDLRPLERLDLLYVTVLVQIPEADRAQVLRILSLIVAPGLSMNGLGATPKFLDALFSSPSGTTRHRLCHLHSVLKMPLEDFDIILPQHATLGDFVFDETRSKQYGFHVDRTQLEEDVVVQISTSLQSNVEGMAGAFKDFLEFFDGRMEQLSPGPLMLRLVENLQGYGENLSSISPLALITFAAPLASKLKTVPSFRVLSRRVIEEAHRRARLYCNNHGRPAVTLLAFSAMIAGSENYSRLLASDYPRFWDSTIGIWTRDKEFGTLSMDRTSGLGFTYVETFKSPIWVSVWARNTWLSLYLPLLVQADFVDAAAAGHRSTHVEFIPTAWGLVLPFDWPTVSALRDCLSATPPEGSGRHVKRILREIEKYLRKHWEKRWHVPSLFLLRRDWDKWRTKAGIKTS